MIFYFLFNKMLNRWTLRMKKFHLNKYFLHYKIHVKSILRFVEALHVFLESSWYARIFPADASVLRNCFTNMSLHDLLTKTIKLSSNISNKPYLYIICVSINMKIAKRVRNNKNKNKNNTKINKYKVSLKFLFKILYNLISFHK